VLDHFTPNKDVQSAENCKIIREFARKYGITTSTRAASAAWSTRCYPSRASWCRETW
jgi:hypothetical protein